VVTNRLLEWPAGELECSSARMKKNCIVRKEEEERKEMQKDNAMCREGRKEEGKEE
jgi:hypothetical protein